MVIELINNLRTAILWNTVMNTGCALIALTLLVLYLRDTRWVKCVLLCCLMMSELSGHDPLSTRVMAAEPNYQFLTVTPKTERELETRTLSEVCSLITDKDYRYCLVDQFKKPVDVITVCHESTHMLDASLSKPGYQGIYLGSGHGIRLKIPNVRLDQITVPPHERGRVWDTYMVESRQWWSENVLYTLLEANGYLNGAKVRAEKGWSNRSETIRYGIELTSYYARAIEAVEKYDETYDTTALNEVLHLLVAQWEVLAPDFKDWPLAYTLTPYGKGYTP